MHVLIYVKEIGLFFQYHMNSPTIKIIMAENARTFLFSSPVNSKNRITSRLVCLRLLTSCQLLNFVVVLLLTICLLLSLLLVASKKVPNA